MVSWFRKPKADRSEIDRYVCLVLHDLQKRVIDLQQEMYAMAVNTDALNANLAKLSADVDLLVAAHADPAGQIAVDAAAAAVAAVDDKVTKALAPAPAPAPAA